MVDNLDDPSAKEVIRSRWKEITGRDVGFPTGFEGARWVRVLPGPSGGGLSSTARLLKAGELVGRHPDGLYVVVGEVGGEAQADVVAIEACGTQQNFETKRHTYGDRSLRLEIGTGWLNEERTVSRQKRYLWQWMGFTSDPSDAGPKVRVPIRMTSVLYAVPPALYSSIRSGVVPYANEYFCKMSSLGSWDAQAFKTFLRGMTFQERLDKSFYNKRS